MKIRSIISNLLVTVVTINLLASISLQGMLKTEKRTQASILIRKKLEQKKKLKSKKNKRNIARKKKSIAGTVFAAFVSLPIISYFWGKKEKNKNKLNIPDIEKPKKPTLPPYTLKLLIPALVIACPLGIWVTKKYLFPKTIPQKRNRWWQEDFNMLHKKKKRTTNKIFV